MPDALIHFDPVGRVRSLDAAAQALLGLTPEAIHGTRMAMLLPGRVAVEQLPGWLEVAQGGAPWEGEAIFRHADGHELPCHVRLTASTEAGQLTGFVQELRALPVARLEALEPTPGAGAGLRRFVAISRLPFVTASVLPVLIGLAVGAWSGAGFHWLAAGLAVAAVLLLHLGANMANDWYDWRSGSDALNVDYVAPFSGGSRALPMGLVTERGLLALIVSCFALGAASGLALAWFFAPWLVWVGLAGGLLGLLYSAPPLRLSSRGGLGELSIFLSFGPLLTLAGVGAAGGPPTWSAAMVGVPTGLWTLGILWINQVPDCEGDRASGKWNLVALLGRRRARVGLPLWLVLGHLATVALVLVGWLPVAALLSLLALPLAVKGSHIAWLHAETDAVAGACAATVQHQLAAAALSLVGITGAAWLG